VTRFIILGLCLLCKSFLAAAQPDPFPLVADAYLVELDGEVVWEKQPDKQLPQASLTKLMTGLLVLEHNQLQDITIIKADAARETGSRLLLKQGDQFRVHDLLEVTLIASANDACHALADHIAGNEAEFVKLMNKRAFELGLTHTRFQNACGHDAPDHYSSVSDLASLAHEILKHPEVTDITSLQYITITSLNGHSYKGKNKNALIGRYSGAIGLKTGSTDNAGKCLVAYVKRDGHDVLLVMLHGQDRWWDAVDMLDLALAHARTH
jgi:D-alanyl-D-alanine carboxypeptidase (penicillin-binding protein 5/6)